MKTIVLLVLVLCSFSIADAQMVVAGRDTTEQVDLSLYVNSNYPNAEMIDAGLYRLTKKMGKGKKLKPGHQAVVHYVGKFINGTVFDSSRDRGQGLEFTLGEGQMIQGWEVGLQGLKKGQVVLLIIGPNMAYGDGGVWRSIPPHAALIFEIELLQIKKGR